MDLGAMTVKGYLAFPNAPAILKPYYQIVLCQIQDIRCEESYHSAEIQLVYLLRPG